MDPRIRKHPLAHCESCPWREDGAYVPSLIPKGEIKVAVVGEAPGAYEAKTGIPFTGPSGELLDRVMEYHGYKRRELALLNTTACRPHGPTEKPPKAAIAACRPRLEADLRRANAPIILAVGGTSAKEILQDSAPISKLRIGLARQSRFGPVVSTWHPAFCVAPGTKILTADLQWIEASAINVGQELIGFDEYQDELTPYSQRRLKPSIVTDVSTLQLPCYKLTLEDGREIVSSGNHMWLAKRYAKDYWRPFDWVQTHEMTKHEFRIAHYLEPWEAVNTREAGYIAGFLDGEGYIGGSQAAWSQNSGPTADYMLQLVRSYGFDISVRPVKISKNSKYVDSSTCMRFEFKSKRDSITALGMFRPNRLINNARKLWEGKKANYQSVLVKSVEYIGIQEVISITTTTKTFIAEGLLSHNCLRTPDSFPSFVHDTGKLSGESKEPWVPPNYKVFNDPATALVAIRRLYSVKRIVIDIEAASDKDIDDAHPEDYDLLCVGVAYSARQVVVFGDKIFKDPACVDAFGALLRTVQVDGWNVKFDLLGLSPLFGMLKAHADGMLMSYVLDERPRQHGLKHRLVEDQNAPRYDDEIAQYTKGKGGSFANIPKDLLHKYNAYDCGGTWDEMEYLSLLMGPQQHRLHAFLIDAVNMLMRVESSPLHFDLAWNAELEGIYAKKIEDSQKDIDVHVGYELNPRSWMQIMKYFASKGMTIPSTSKELLEKIHPLCEPEIQKFIDLILINRNLAKAYGTYVKGLRRKVKDGKIYTTFSLHATTSGRTASRKPNLQNVKRDKLIRNQFTAEPPSEENPDGKILVQCDYSQAEGRTIADLARDSYLQQVFSDPTIDIFNDMCDRIWLPGNWDKENRVSIKSIFYGYSYGRKAKSIARELDKPVEYAVDLMNEFKALIPSVVAWQAAIRHEVLEKQELWTTFGRKRSFHLITNENMEDVINEALSFKPQSIASDICLRAAVNLQPKLKEQFDSDIKLLIHDAIVAECRPQDREAVVELMRQEMVYSGRLYTEFVPFKVDASWGFRLGEL